MLHLIKRLWMDKLGQREDIYEWRTFQGSIDMAGVSTVCILHTDDKLGDAVINSALVDGLSKLAPNCAIDIGTSPAFEPYWKSHPKVRNVVPFPQRGVGGFRQKISAIRSAAAPWQEKWDVVICFDSFSFFDSFLLLSELRAKTVIGFNKNHYRLFDYSLDDFRYGTQKRHVKHRVESILQVFGKVEVFENLEQWCGYDDDARREATTVSALAKEGFGKLYFNTYGASPDRTLTPENTFQVVRTLDEVGSKQCVFVSAARDKLSGYHRAFDNNALKNVQVEFLPPLSSYFALFAVLDQMDSVISPDTAVSHIAAVRDTPQLCLFRDDTYNPIHWMPNSDRCEALVSTSGKDVNDIDWVTLKEALGKILSPT